MEPTSVVKISWFVTGYHKFKIRPRENEELNLFTEKDIRFDPYAVLVKTKSGVTIGRVPANLCRLLRLLKDFKMVHTFKCLYTNSVIRLENHTKKFEKRVPFDGAGHGAVLTCIYTFECKKKMTWMK